VGGVAVTVVSVGDELEGSDGVTGASVGGAGGPLAVVELTGPVVVVVDWGGERIVGSVCVCVRPDGGGGVVAGGGGVAVAVVVVGGTAAGFVGALTAAATAVLTVVEATRIGLCGAAGAL
jgi:hypothetical protein